VHVGASARHTIVIQQWKWQFCTLFFFGPPQFYSAFLANQLLLHFYFYRNTAIRHLLVCCARSIKRIAYTITHTLGLHWSGNGYWIIIGLDVYPALFYDNNTDITPPLFSN
jgi:hypothetical protein